MQKQRGDITPAPKGGQLPVKEEPLFVIQKHAASHLHYDFRLENEGVLVSWVLQNGPSTDPAVKCLAMHVEDHPLDYARFEGIIPKGQYGGGTVMVWDQGTFVNLSNRDGERIPLSAGLTKGHINFWLNGQKLKGGWSLIRTSADEKQWQLIKMNDAGAHYPPLPTESEPDSALSQRTMNEIAVDKKSRIWQSNRAT